MKRLIALLPVLLMCVGLAGCSESDDTTDKSGLKLSEKSLEFTSAEGLRRVTITTAEKWTVKSSQDWCAARVFPDAIAVVVEKNYTSAARNAEVTVTAGEHQAVIAVSQEAGDGVYNAFQISSVKYKDLPSTGSGEISLASSGEILHISVKITDPKCSWSAALMDDADFLTLPEMVNQKSDQTVAIVVSENPLAREREAKIKFWSEHQGLKWEYILTLKQEAGEGVLNAFDVKSSAYPSLPMRGGAELALPFRQREIPLQVISTNALYKWSVEVVEGADVVTIPELKDCEGTQEFTLTVNENPTAAARTAKVKISSRYEDLECVYVLDLAQELSQYAGLQVLAGENEIKVMSFNVWVNVKSSDPLGWPNRRESCYEMIRYHRPTIVGLQETMYSTSWTDLINALRADGYQGFAVVRADGSQSGNREGTGLLYDAKVLKLEKSGNFWLSNPTTAPVSGETGRDWFGAQYMRVANWAIFTHKDTGKTICYINTHLDLKQPARVKEMELIMQKFEEFGVDCDYWISTADYNAVENSEEMQVAYDKLKNARSATPAGKTDNDRTYNGTEETGGSVIDHVLCSKDMEVVEYHTIDDNYGTAAYVSDHYPVYAIIKIK